MKSFIIASPIAILVIVLIVYVPLIITKPPDGPVFTSKPGQITWIGTAIVSNETLRFTKQVREVIFTDNFEGQITFEAPRNDFGGLRTGLNSRIQYQEIWTIETFPWWDIPSAHHHRKWKLLSIEKLDN